MDFNEYKYDPHPPGAKNPLISHHQASMFLNCDRQCHPFWKLLHECVPDLIDTRTIDKIPKKQSRFSLDSTQPQDSAAWGLQAQYEVSAIYVAVYHLVILIPPFVFWGWWQSKHPNDLQNASIPATVAIGLLSIFWGTNGILTHGRQPVGRSL